MPIALANLPSAAANLRFADPLWFLALLAIPLVIWLRGFRSVPVLLVPFASAWHRPSLAGVSRWPVALAALGLALLVAALARPQKVDDRREVTTQGYDLMLAIDLSGSMLAEDYERNGERINRLQAIKPVIQAFINERPHDRIGVVVFADHAYTLAPLTFDHRWLARQLERLRVGLVGAQTAIGDGLGIALTRLEQSGRNENEKRKGAFVVLLTDGANNRGALAPAQAAGIAKSRGIPVYTIGAGREGRVPYPNMDDQGRKVGGYHYFESDLDEETLRQIARETGGQYFRAHDSRTVQAAFAAIDQAEKIEFESKSYLVTTELFTGFAAAGAACVFLAALLSRKRRATAAAAGSWEAGVVR
ncbi:MAG: VWA domain-containing protein [Opitutaceae bacterium]|jgi:Ca-activated chloride channel family protein|nr:VWA domain-containing protein [Opitutaceae bacterium]